MQLGFGPSPMEHNGIKLNTWQASDLGEGKLSKVVDCRPSKLIG